MSRISQRNLIQRFERDDVQSSDDHIYYNMILTNNTTANIKASFSQTRTDAILDTPSEYYLSVIRFLIPTSAIPIFTFQDNTYSVSLSYNPTPSNPAANIVVQTFVTFLDSDYPNAQQNIFSYNDLNKDVYSYNSFIYRINDAFAICLNNPITGLNARIVAAGFTPLTYNAPFLEYDPISKLITLYADIDGYFTQVPKLTSANIIWMNTALFGFFQSFQNFYNGSDTTINPLSTFGRNYQLLVQFKGSNIKNVSPPIGPTIIVTTNDNIIDFQESAGALVATVPAVQYNSPQELAVAIQLALNTAPSVVNTYTVTYDLSTDKFIIISLGTTFSLLFGTGAHASTSIAPLIGFAAADITGVQMATGNTEIFTFNAVYSTQEYTTLFAWNALRSISFSSGSLPIQPEYLPGNSPSNGQQVYSTLLTDFIIDVSESPEARSYIQYVPQGEYRLISLGGTTPLKTFDMNLLWVDNIQQSHQIYLPPAQTLSAKLMFRKKSFNKKI